MIPNRLREYDAVQPAAGTATIARRDVDVRRLPWVRPLASEYAERFWTVAEFFAGDPWSPAGWRDAVARVHAHRHDTNGVADVLLAQAQRRGAPPASIDAIRQLRDADTVAVVTGQQAGLFGGPLYTLLKALTAIQLAARVREEQGVRAVAIFWVDAEDHDWEEVRSCAVLDQNLEYRTVSLGVPEGAGERPVASITLGDDVERAIAELEQALQPTEFTAEVIGALRECYQPARGMSEAFARWLERLLGDRGLVVFESADRAAKPFVAELFARELSEPGRTSALALASGEAMRLKGHEPQVVPQPESVALFKLDGGRRPIRVRGDHLLIDDRPVSRDALIEEARGHPERFSPNVLLRPLVQDTLFPTIAYVSGPSELAYLGQLRDVYARFDIAMPLIYPRASATLLDSGSTRFLSRYDVPLEALRAQDESALNRLLDSQLPPAVEHALHEADIAVRQRMTAIVESVSSIDPTLAGATQTTLGRMQHDLHTLHNKIIHAAKKKDETLRRQFARAQAQAFPAGHPQERAIGIPFFLNRYGWSLLTRLEAELPLETGKHWILTP